MLKVSEKILKIVAGLIFGSRFVAEYVTLHTCSPAGRFSPGSGGSEAAAPLAGLHPQGGREAFRGGQEGCCGPFLTIFETLASKWLDKTPFWAYLVGVKFDKASHPLGPGASSSAVYGRFTLC
jgi:hypothetical protein